MFTMLSEPVVVAERAVKPASKKDFAALEQT